MRFDCITVYIVVAGPTGVNFLDCREAYQKGCREDGVYTIDPGCGRPFSVFCDMKNGGWTVFQRRMDGSQDFFKGWADYVAGFGSLKREFWLGLDHIHCLTSTVARTELRVELADFEGNYKYAHYSFFSVGNSGTNYRLNIAGYTGTAGDSLGYQNRNMFSTKDKDNDRYSANCAAEWQGGWWYGHGCHLSLLNGGYLSGQSSSGGVRWYHFHGNNISMKFAEMKLRFCN